MNNPSTNPDDTSHERPNPSWSGKLGVWLLLGAVLTAFVLVTLIVLSAPLTRNELGVLGGLKVEANSDTLVYVGERYIGAGTVEVPWNTILGAAGEPSLAVPSGSDDSMLADEDSELVWSEDGPEGVYRGTQNANYSFRQELHRRAGGELDHLFVIACEFPDAEGQWKEFQIPIRTRKRGDGTGSYFPQPGIQGGGNVDRGMIPSRRDAATFQLKLQVLDGAWPSAVEVEGDEVLWAPERPDKQSD